MILLLVKRNHGLDRCLDIWYELIVIDLLTLFLHIQLSFSFDWKEISNTRDSVSPHSKRIEVCQKHSVARRIYNSLLLSIWKYSETRSLLFDILPQKNNREGAKMRLTFEQKWKKLQATKRKENLLPFKWKHDSCLERKKLFIFLGKMVIFILYLLSNLLSA